MNGRTSQDLLNVLDKHFNNADLRELARDIGTNYENLAGDTKRGRILSLIEFVEHREKGDELWKMVMEKRPFLQKEGEPVQMKKFSIDTIKWIALVLGVIAAVITIIQLWQSIGGEKDPEQGRILLQVQVNNSENQQAVANATVFLDVANQLFPQQRTDGNGRAVFELSTALVGDLASITVQVNEQVQKQTITVDLDMRPVEFQMRP